jgi:hypothetical protein
VSFEDYDDVINPGNFNGVFEAVQVGATIPGLGIGGAAGYMRLGKAFTPMEIGSIFTLTFGRDRSISGTLGKSTVIDSKIVNCPCN